jgi:hypothetical protein
MQAIAVFSVRQQSPEIVKLATVKPSQGCHAGLGRMPVGHKSAGGSRTRTVLACQGSAGIKRAV